MPVFDYHCSKCAIQEERLVKKYDDIQHCNTCQGEMAKLPCSPSFVLKGAGFYSNGTYAKAKEGPKLDQDLLKLSDSDLNYECGLPRDMD